MAGEPQPAAALDEGTARALEALQSRKRKQKEDSMMRVLEKRRLERLAQKAEDEANFRNYERFYHSDEVLSQQSGFRVYYCASCSTYALICDKRLEKFGQRKADGARILVTARRTFKTSLLLGPQRLIRRGEAVERQHRLICSHCKLPVAYTAEPPGQTPAKIFLLPGALTDKPALFAEARPSAEADAMVTQPPPPPQQQQQQQQKQK